MKVKALDETHLLVILTAQEADSLGLGAKAWSGTSLTCRMAIARLFAAACEKVEFAQCRDGNLAGIFDKIERIGIHAMSTQGGQWVLVFSAHPPRALQSEGEPRKVYRVKCAAGPYIYRFAACGDMLNLVERLYRMGQTCGCSLIVLEKEYYLILRPKCRSFASLNCLLREYGSLWGRGQGACAFLQEHGKMLAADAVSMIGAHLV